MYRGKGAPAISDMQGNEDSVVYLPAVIRGERREDFKIETKTYTNIFGKRIVGQTRYRFEGNYKFGEIVTGDLAKVTSLADESTIIKWIPHSDMPWVNFMCVIKELKIPPLDGLITKDSLEIRVEGVEFVNSIPNADNMFGGFTLYNIGNHTTT